ncbi:MAG: ABC transporter substrate-binding protein [Alphaproteobacteria bacterium]|jgi:branched-chain amino acid transport system substrate-binding protein|nr:ABC transporter substrate-binding protein [Alphaproteobacteria bacterium]MBT4016626.1 ABC transporter substrate-binding protein [Alphaproteobacteria bacterium]MBT4964704.1 ABC transporter substrate-binding protein [Alphaproteobacteria bacterium]MBT5161155.1 ABC transporter substrate-binding protein [Alphaproteobacteria bacterium]MBT7746634.1 ABC transporter substrate-binding protein [Alphaproteobacteria bacterium]
MKLKTKILLGVTAALMPFALNPASSDAAEVKVGVVLTYSGGAAHLGKQIDQGMQLYMDSHPEAFGGHTVKLIKRDSKRPGGDIAKNAVQELITREGVKILAGFMFSPNAMASAPLATQGKVPMIIMNAGTAWIPSLSPYIARVSFTMWHSGYPLGKYAGTELGCKTAAAGYTDYPPGKDSRNAFKTGFETTGGSLIEDIPMGGPREVPDFTPFFQRVKNAKPDCFFVFVPAGNHATAVVKTYEALAMADAGIRLIGPGDITQDTELQGMGKGAIGMITMHHYAADYDTPQNKKFVAAWKKAYGADSTPDFMAVGGWDGMAAIAHAVKTQNGNVSADGTMAALSGWSFASPRGQISIDADTRDIVMDVNVHKVVQRNGRLAIEVIGTVPQVKDPCKELKIGKCGK